MERIIKKREKKKGRKRGKEEKGEREKGEKEKEERDERVKLDHRTDVKCVVVKYSTCNMRRRCY